jgi:predicted lysophospholipase L1 biosynthesis ABC-type transport system permease subunit
MNQKHQEDLSHIRSMMERSSRFISLSGLSGVFAGLSALIGGLYAYQLFKSYGIEYFDSSQIQNFYLIDLVIQLIFIALIVLVFSLTFGIFFTIRKSRKYNLPVWTAATKNMLLNLAIPLMVGGVFCLALLHHQIYVLIAPATLLFYGLALVNAEKYTFSDIKYLGFCELVLGCVSLFFLGYGLVFWIIGFGILHILYGLIVFKKYK